MATSMRRVIQFDGGGLPPDTLEVVSFKGEEVISRLFRFELELVSKKRDVDFTAMLTLPAHLALKQGVAISGGQRAVKVLKIHGFIASFEQFEKGFDWITYRAVLVPRLWRLSLNIQSQIYIDKTVPEIVEEELKKAGFTKEDYLFLTTARKYPKREYVVQYLESDLDFISRLCEHEGIFFYFQHREGAARVVFGDSPSAFNAIQGKPAIPYRPQNTSAQRVEAEEGGAGEWFEQEAVHSLVSRQNMIPSEVILKDYNWRTPTVDLKVTAGVDPHGQGSRYLFGEHFKDADEGGVYAAVRAEEIVCRKKQFVGTSDAKAFRAGATYALEEHYRKDFNQKYLITDIRHEGAQPIELATSSSGVLPMYRNEFTSIPADAPYRPERLTPKPRVAGVFSAKVDGGGSAQYAEIDEHGRYKVQIPFDLSGRGDGKASRFVRMAQPYAGAGMGMHFPLHKGTEVILLHTNGDPDRPLIAAAVPNPDTSSPVTGDNHTSCAINTGGGSKISIQDGDGAQQMKMECPTEGSFFAMGAANSPAGFNFGSTAHMNVNLGGNDLLVANGKRDHTIMGKTTMTHVGKHTTTIAASKMLTVGGSNTTTITGKDTATTGQSTLTVRGKRGETITGAHGISNQKMTTKSKSTWFTQANSSLTAKSPKVTCLGKSHVLLKSGGTTAKLMPGSTNMKSPKIALTGKSRVDATASKIALGGKSQVDVKSPTTTVEGKSKLGLKGANITVKGKTKVVGETTVQGKSNFTQPMKVKGTTFTVD